MRNGSQEGLVTVGGKDGARGGEAGAEVLVDLPLLVHRELVQLAQDQRDGEDKRPHEGLIVDGGAQLHEELAIEPVHQPPVSGDDGVEVLDLVGPLDGGGEEPPERGDEGGEGAEGDAVQLDGAEGHRGGTGEPRQLRG